MKCTDVSWRGTIGRFSGGMQTQMTTLLDSSKGKMCLKLIVLLLIIGGVELNPGPETRGADKSGAASQSAFELILARLTSIDNKMNRIEEMTQKHDDQIRELQVHCEKLRKDFVDMCDNVDNIMHEKLDQERRRKSIIIMGIPEGERSDEVKTAVDVVKVLLPSYTIPQHKIERVGIPKAGAQYPRPIRVKLKSFDDKMKALKNRPNLTDEVFNNLKVKPDLTVRQRNERRQYYLQSTENPSQCSQNGSGSSTGNHTRELRSKRKADENQSGNPKLTRTSSTRGVGRGRGRGRSN